jgi:hypothetical protein
MKSSKILLATSLWISPFLSLAHLSSASSKFNYSFICYPSPHDGVYSTRIEFSDGKKADMIYWKKSSNPRKKCADVSSKFQEFKESRRLTYLSFGKSSSTGQSIVCGLAKTSDSCDDNSKIFTLLPGTTPESTVEGLREAISGTNSPIYQGADDELIINFEDLIGKISQRQEKKR